VPLGVRLASLSVRSGSTFTGDVYSNVAKANMFEIVALTVETVSDDFGHGTIA
jgi:hypothetical protein